MREGIQKNPSAIPWMRGEVLWQSKEKFEHSSTDGFFPQIRDKLKWVGSASKPLKHHQPIKLARLARNLARRMNQSRSRSNPRGKCYVESRLVGRAMKAVLTPHTGWDRNWSVRSHKSIFFRFLCAWCVPKSEEIDLDTEVSIVSCVEQW